MKGGIWWAGWLSSSLLLQAADADDYRTPRAGEEYRTELWGIPITAPAFFCPANHKLDSFASYFMMQVL